MASSPKPTCLYPSPKLARDQSVLVCGCAVDGRRKMAVRSTNCLATGSTVIPAKAGFKQRQRLTRFPLFPPPSQRLRGGTVRMTNSEAGRTFQHPGTARHQDTCRPDVAACLTAGKRHDARMTAFAVMGLRRPVRRQPLRRRRLHRRHLPRTARLSAAAAA